MQQYQLMIWNKLTYNLKAFNKALIIHKELRGAMVFLRLHIPRGSLVQMPLTSHYCGKCHIPCMVITPPGV
jgi:hypothetical protein